MVDIRVARIFNTFGRDLKCIAFCGQDPDIL